MGVSLTERLLAFARKQHLEPQVTDIGQLVEGMADLLEIAVPSDIALAFDMPDAPVLSLIDPGQLESAILNLCVNAGQAIEGHGTICVALRDEGGARLTITDSGAGMPPEVLRHATEPFFSKRHDGSGTGLGLSMVDGFVHQSGGQLRLASRTEGPERGTTVTLQFPPVPDARSAPAPAQGAGRALVVDDDPAYLASAAEALTRLGFEVIRAARFSEGIDRLEAAPHLDLILSDLNLDNGASGWEFLQRGRARFPECRLALMSTREMHGIPRDLAATARPVTLTKPLSDTTLREMLLVE